MAYNELIKNFDRIRDYMREFYVYGFRSRDEFDRKSARSYDDERRRIESWLKEYMGFRHTSEGKNVFISIDSRETEHNPLYAAWKAKSFTDGDITLHFIIFDILHSPDVCLSFAQITEMIDCDYLSEFSGHRVFDESTIRKKLKEYTECGMLISEKQGRSVVYRRADDTEEISTDVLDFYSEAVPCGVIGSFLLDREKEHRDMFAFKHHYINYALDSEILCSLFQAIRNRNSLIIETPGRVSSQPVPVKVMPLMIFISVRTGRQYLVAYSYERERICPFRIDFIRKVRKDGKAENFEHYREKLLKLRENMWGVNTGPDENITCHVEFTVNFAPHEQYIVNRLEREKRCGKVEITGDGKCRFSADVFDVSEMIPWIRTFICRITDLSFSDKEAEKRFRDDMDAMYRMYDIEEEATE